MLRTAWLIASMWIAIVRRNSSWSMSAYALNGDPSRGRGSRAGPSRRPRRSPRTRDASPRRWRTRTPRGRVVARCGRTTTRRRARRRSRRSGGRRPPRPVRCSCRRCAGCGSRTVIGPVHAGAERLRRPGLLGDQLGAPREVDEVRRSGSSAGDSPSNPSSRCLTYVAYDGFDISPSLTIDTPAVDLTRDDLVHGGLDLLPRARPHRPGCRRRPPTSSGRGRRAAEGFPCACIRMRSFGHRRFAFLVASSGRVEWRRQRSVAYAQRRYVRCTGSDRRRRLERGIR